MFLKCYTKRRTITRAQGSGFPSRIPPEIQQIIEDAMREDDETTTTQLQAKLAAFSVHVSLGMICRSRAQLGWIYRGSAYCQLIREANKQKRLDFAVANLYQF